MQFELTEELSDLIIFAMENQHEEFALDTETFELVPLEEVSEEALDEGDGLLRYVPVPEWTPADGFRLMERFVAGLQNPVYREKLTAALAGGKGVFRRFKDTVKERPDIERRWFTFKEQAMREVVTEWYNDLRDAWGLERIAVEPAETEDLVLSDFTIRQVEGEAPIAFEAEAPAGETAARASARTGAGDGGSSRLVVAELFVEPAFRGLGLGTLLLERLVETARREGWASIDIELAGEGLILDEPAAALGFQTTAKRMRLDLG
jgi:GNAT superfamily N-acetyltransferase